MRNLTTAAYAWAQARKDKEDGQGVVEYALIVGAVSVVLIGVLAGVATGWINDVTAKVTDALNPA